MIGIGGPNRFQPDRPATLGSWLAALPANNVCTRRHTLVARSTDALAASTKFCVDLGAARVLRAFALANHNLSTDGQWRVLLGTTAGDDDVFSGTFADWLHTVTDDTITALGMEDDEYLRDWRNAYFVPPSAMSARYVTVEIDDETNPDGYVQVGRGWASGLFVPEHNISYGFPRGWDDLSTKERAESGSLWATPRRRLRRLQFVLEALGLEEGNQLDELQRVLGTCDDVLFLPSLTDMKLTQRYGVIGTFNELNNVEWPYPRINTLAASITQTV